MKLLIYISRAIKMSRFLCLILFVSISLSAQIWPEKSPTDQFWDGPNLLSVSRDSNEATLEGPSASKGGRSHRLPEWLHYQAFRDGIHYGFQRSKGGGRVSTILESRDLKTWTPFGLFRDELISFVPLDDGRFFMSSLLGPFLDGQKASHMGIFRRNDHGEFVLDSLVAFPWPKPLLQPTGKRDSKGQPYMEIPSKLGVIQQTFGEYPIHLKDHFCIFNRQTGWILVFDMAKGNLKRTVKVYPSIDEERITKDGSRLEVGLLGLQPTKAGDLLLAMRMEDAVLNSRKIFPSGPERVQPNEDPWEAEKRFIPEQRISIKAWPEILYRRMDPETGDLRPEIPKGLPQKVKSLEQLKQFQFRMRANGTPEMD